jgi:hypothetical protein
VNTKQVERPVPSLRSTPVIGAALELRDNYLGTLLRAARVKLAISRGCTPDHPDGG